MLMEATAVFWVGRVLTSLFALFMLAASLAPNLLGLAIAKTTLTDLGWDPRYSLMIGLIGLACLVFCLFPRTSVFGAVLTTARLGGAITTQIRVDNPLVSHTLFSFYLGLLTRGGLWLRDRRCEPRSTSRLNLSGTLQGQIRQGRGPLIAERSPT